MFGQFQYATTEFGFLPALTSSLSANAGLDQRLAYLATTTSLSGSGSGGVGPLTYSWTQSSGPNTATIGSPSSASTSLSGMRGGTYVFVLTVNDGTNTATDSVTVIIPVRRKNVKATFVQR